MYVSRVATGSGNGLGEISGSAPPLPPPPPPPPTGRPVVARARCERPGGGVCGISSVVGRSGSGVRGRSDPSGFGCEEEEDEEEVEVEAEVEGGAGIAGASSQRPLIAPSRISVARSARLGVENS